MDLEAAVAYSFNSLTGSLFPSGSVPKLYYGQAPPTNSSGEQVRQSGGYVTYQIRAQTDEQGFEGDLETSELMFSAYAIGADTAKQIIRALRFNGQAPSAGSGFDNRETLPFFSDGSAVLVGIFPTKPPETTQEPATDKDGKYVFKCVMVYRVLIDRPS